jgi:uncharacterized membrane-anchored protein YhcB (DUF1043 family)
MSIIDLEDAVRAAKDRPSMERELQDLREQLLATEKARDWHIERSCKLLDCIKHSAEAYDKCATDYANMMLERDRLRGALEMIANDWDTPLEDLQDMARAALKGEGDL